MPEFSKPEYLTAFNKNSMINEELDYDSALLKEKLRVYVPKLNSEQIKIFDAINLRLNNNEIGKNYIFL